MASDPKAQKIYNQPLPQSLPPNSVLAIVRDGCAECGKFLARSEYPTTTEDGRPITYVTDNHPGGKEYFMRHVAGHLTADAASLPLMLNVDDRGQIGDLIAWGPDAALKTLFPLKDAALHAGKGVAGTCHVHSHEGHADLPPTPAAPGKCGVGR